MTTSYQKNRSVVEYRQNRGTIACPSLSRPSKYEFRIVYAANVFLTALKRHDQLSTNQKRFLLTEHGRTRISSLRSPVARVSRKTRREPGLRAVALSIEACITCISRREPRRPILECHPNRRVHCPRSSSSSWINWPFLKARFSENLPENRYDNTATDRCHPETTGERSQSPLILNKNTSLVSLENPFRFAGKISRR